MSTTLLKIKLIVIVCLLAHSCVSDIDFDYPNNAKQAVLNCVLQNDSIIKVSMCWAGSANDTVFVPITNADISLFEDNIKIEVVPQLDVEGNYVFIHKVKGGVQYRVVANIADIELSAVADTPKESYIVAERTNDSYSPEYALKVLALDESISALYIYVFTKQHDDRNGPDYIHEFLYCNSPFADPFNNALDDSGPVGYFYSYDYFVRVDAEYIRNNEAVIYIASGSRNQSLQVIRVILANENYDTYYKSAFIQRSFDPEINLPFTYYAVPVPSNIKGGLGQFSAIDIKEFAFKTTKY